MEHRRRGVIATSAAARRQLSSSLDLPPLSPALIFFVIDHPVAGVVGMVQ